MQQLEDLVKSNMSGLKVNIEQLSYIFYNCVKLLYINQFLQLKFQAQIDFLCAKLEYIIKKDMKKWENTLCVVHTLTLYLKAG